MSIPRYYTLGAVAPDARSLAGLAERLDGLPEGRPGEGSRGEPSVSVLCRRRDEELARAVLPEARVLRVRTGLTKRQWLEFGSTYFSASTVSFLMGVVHLWTGLVVQAVLTVASVAGIFLYGRRPRLERTLLGFGLPEKLAGEWAAAFPGGLALVLLTVPAELVEDAQDAFLEDDALRAPLAVDRRPVL